MYARRQLFVLPGNAWAHLLSHLDLTRRQETKVIDKRWHRTSHAERTMLPLCISFVGSTDRAWTATCCHTSRPSKSLGLCCRVLRKVPEAIETFADKAAGLLTDRHHGVLLSGTTLMLEICEIDPNTIEQYRRHVPMLCKILRSLLMSGFAPEHDVGGITDPFLQVKVIAARLATLPYMLHLHMNTST